VWLILLELWGVRPGIFWQIILIGGGSQTEVTHLGIQAAHS